MMVAETVEAKPLAEREVVFKPVGETEPVRLTIALVKKFLMPPTKNGVHPTDADAMKFMMLCKASGLNPWVGDAIAVGYDADGGVATFNLITTVQALFKRAELHPEYDGIESGVIVRRNGDKEASVEYRAGDFFTEDEALLGGWARVYRKDVSRPTYEAIKLATFNKGVSLWKWNPEGMIVKCFDDQTEVLTLDGFKKFSDVDSPIMQVTGFGLEPVEAKPFFQWYSGDMVLLDSDDLNFCVTPNHDMITMSGREEAGSLFERSRSRAVEWIPRIPPPRKVDADISDEALMISAVYLADGYDRRNGTFDVSVSKPKKLAMLESIGLFASRYSRKAAGAVAVTVSRNVTTKSDKTTFVYRDSVRGGLVGRGRVVNKLLLASLSQRQARIFVDTLLSCDGSVAKKTGVRRFYQTRISVLEAFELAAIIAGYSISDRKPRWSDISTEANWSVTISDRDEIGVRRWGRYCNYSRTTGSRKHTGLEIVRNRSGKVWCVTVPSGTIVVRRNGFSMQCGNCAEAGSLRKAFPNQLSGLYTREEMDAVNIINAPEKPKIVSNLDSLSKELESKRNGVEHRPGAQELVSVTNQEPDSVEPILATKDGEVSSVAVDAMSDYKSLIDDARSVENLRMLALKLKKNGVGLSEDQKEFLLRRIESRREEF